MEMENYGYTFNQLYSIKKNQDEAISLGFNSLERILEFLDYGVMRPSDLQTIRGYAEKGITGMTTALKRNPTPPSEISHKKKGRENV